MQLLSRSEVALKLGVCTASVSNYVKKGRIQKVGNLFDLDSYVSYHQSKSTKPKRQTTILCEYCNQPFVVNSTNGLNKVRKFCSNKCQQLGCSRTDIWSPEEIETFKAMLEEMPCLMVSDSWNRIAQEKGWKQRSFISLQAMRRKHSSPKPSLKRQSWTLREIARILNINLHRPATRWQKEGLSILIIPNHPKFIAVSRENIKKYAARRPKDFYGIPIDRLNVIFQDMKFTKEIFELAFADTRSQCFTIVKLEGGVFKSQGIAAKELNLGISSVEHNIRREKNVKGHNLVKLDYPKYLAPAGYEDEFNSLAGNILVEVYNELKVIHGYTKLGIQAVAVRQAVDIALISFRAHFRNISNEVSKERTLEMIAEFWKNKVLSIFKKHQILRNNNRSRAIITANLKRITYNVFSSYNDKQEEHFLEFVNHFISSYSEKYLRKSCLPWQIPSETFINSDMFTLIECMSTARMNRGGKLYPVAKLNAYSYIKKNRPSSSFNPDWVEHTNYEASQSSNESIESLEIIIQGLDNLVIDEKLKQDCKQYVKLFCTHGDSLECKNKMGIDWKYEREILDVLKQSAMLNNSPF